MQVKRLFEVDYEVNLPEEEGKGVFLGTKKGHLYLTLKSFILGAEDVWYEILINDIKDILYRDHDDPRLEIVMRDVVLTVRGKRKESLLGLQHFMLPYIRPEC